MIDRCRKVIRDLEDRVFALEQCENISGWLLNKAAPDHQYGRLLDQLSLLAFLDHLGRVNVELFDGNFDRRFLQAV